MKYCLYIIIFLFAFSAKAQNAKEDIKKVNESYVKHKDLSMGITYNVFAAYDDNVPMETSAGSYNQHGNARYNRLNEIESVQNSDFSLVIDHDEKMIVIGNPIKFNPGKIMLLDLDSALSMYSSVKYIDNNVSQKGYSMVFKPTAASEYDKVDMYFNAKTYLVERMVFYYRDKVQLKKTNQDAPEEKPKLEIIFSKISVEPVSDFKFYSAGRFVDKKNGKYVGVGECSSYKVINQKIVQ